MRQAAKPFLFAVTLSLASLATAQAGAAANDLIRAVLANELRHSDQDPSRWTYESTRVENGQNQTKRVVETRDGSLDRLISMNGQALSVEKQQQETARINKLVGNPQQLEKLERIRKKDAEQCLAFFKMLPEAFLYSYAGQEGGSMRLAFKPNPGFQTSSWQARVLHAMEGEILIDVKDQRLAAISGWLVDDVKFGGGLLGQLKRGGHFHVERSNVGFDHWEVVAIDVNMNGKALLLKAISVNQKESKANFRRVSDNLTAQEAAAALNNPVVVALNSR